MNIGVLLFIGVFGITITATLLIWAERDKRRKNQQ